MLRDLFVAIAKDKFQMLAITMLVVALGQNADGELEDVQLGDAGARIAEQDRGRGVDRQGGDLADRVPARGRDAGDDGVQDVSERHDAIGEEEADGDFGRGAARVVGESFKVGGDAEPHPVGSRVNIERVAFPGEPMVTIQT